MLNGVSRRSLLIVAISMCVSVANALTIDHGDRKYELNVDELAADSDFSLLMYAPFRGKEVLFEGYRLNDFLSHVTGHPVETATFYAIDGYHYKIDDIPSSSWVLVTKENGHRLTLREHGPLRLIETDLNGRTPHNLALFDNWIWMIDRIVVGD